MNGHILPNHSYAIRFDSSFEQNDQQGWFVAVQYGHSHTSRTPTTQYAKIERVFGLIKADRQWRFIPAENGTFIISVGSSGPFKGFQLVSGKVSQNDVRDDWSYKAFVAAPGHGFVANKWILHYLGDSIYLIQNRDTKFFLSAHRFCQNDKVSDSETLLITHSNQKIAGCWKIAPY